jgi:hypothetical protein
MAKQLHAPSWQHMPVFGGEECSHVSTTSVLPHSVTVQLLAISEFKDMMQRDELDATEDSIFNTACCVLKIPKRRLPEMFPAVAGTLEQVSMCACVHVRAHCVCVKEGGILKGFIIHQTFVYQALYICLVFFIHVIYNLFY